MTPNLGIEPGPHWCEARTVTTAKACFYFLLESFKSEEKLETMFMQNYGRKTKSIMVFLSGLLNNF